jgi:hypothetical protein
VGVADLAAVVMVVRELLDDEEAQQAALLEGVEQRRPRLDGAWDTGDAERVPVLAGQLGHDERRRRPRPGLHRALPVEHLHQSLHDCRRRADPAQSDVAQPRAPGDVDEDADADA